MNTNPKSRCVDFPYVSSVRIKEKLIWWYFCISLLSSIRRQAALPIFRFLTACIFISSRRGHEMILADEFEESVLTLEENRSNFTHTLSYRRKFYLFTVCMFVCVLSRVWLCDPMDYSPPGSSVHGTSWAIILEWVAISFSRVSFQPRDWTHVFCIWQTNSLPLAPPGKPSPLLLTNHKQLFESLPLLYAQVFLGNTEIPRGRGHSLSPGEIHSVLEEKWHKSKR